MKRLWISISLVLLLILTGCGSSNQTTGQEVKVTRGDITIYVSGSGKFQVAEDVKLSFGTSGKIIKLAVKEGIKVKKDDILAELDTDSLNLAQAQAQTAVTQAQANVEAAKLTLSRTQRTDTWKEYDAAKADVDDAKSLVTYVSDNLSKATTPANVETWSIALVRAQAQLAAAEIKLNALLAGFDTEDVALRKIQLTAAEQALIQSQMALAQVQKQLKETVIIAPWDGTVAVVYPENGDIVTAGMPVIELLDMSKILLKATIDEIDILKIKKGQKAGITSDSFPGITLSGTVESTAILPTFNAGVISYTVTITFPYPKETDIKIGMSATADIILESKTNTLLVPSRAIATDDQSNSIVYLKSNDKIESRTIKTGLSDGIQTEIFDGLSENDIIVVESRSSSGMGLFGE